MIAIIDYGMGNLHSVSKAVERLGYDVITTDQPELILSADAVILPGVGAYGDAMRHLSETGLGEVAKQYAASGKPMLGICLGMQLLFEQSEEFGVHQGLGLLQGKVVKFQGEFKIPHMGWNKLTFLQPSPLLESLAEGHVYFVHSYHVLVENKENLLATGDYYGPVTAIVAKDNVFGMQFHPEKSGVLGMELLRNFLAMSVRS